MKVTFSIDAAVVARVRRLAESRASSMNQLVREYLEALAAAEGPEAALEELERSWAQKPGDSAGRTWNRDDLYDRSVLR